MMYDIRIQGNDSIWIWELSAPEETLAYGSCHTLDEACRCARIAWEQHSKGEES
jgi:hypothetical protein